MLKPDFSKGNLLRHAFLIAVAAIFLLPIYVDIVNTFKTRTDIVAAPLSIPFDRLTLANLERNIASPKFNILAAYGSSGLITALTVGFTIFLGGGISFVVARRTGRFLRFSHFLLMAGLTIPAQVILLPIVQILRALGLMFTMQGLILMNVAWYMPFVCFVFIIFISLWAWNDFVNPLIILGSSGFYTVTTGMYQAIGQFVRDGPLSRHAALVHIGTDLGGAQGLIPARQGSALQWTTPAPRPASPTTRQE